MDGGLSSADEMNYVERLSTESQTGFPGAVGNPFASSVKRGPMGSQHYSTESIDIADEQS